LWRIYNRNNRKTINVVNYRLAVETTLPRSREQFRNTPHLFQKYATLESVTRIELRQRNSRGAVTIIAEPYGTQPWRAPQSGEK